VIVYKFMRPGARGLVSQQEWPGPGTWIEVGAGSLVACRHGVHVCRVQDLPYWIAEELWEVEIGDEWIDAPDALVARRARLTRQIERWTAVCGDFGRACVARAREHVADHGFESGHPAAQYLNEAEKFAHTENVVVAAYAAALVFGAAVGSAMEGYRAERLQQSMLLASAVGLA